LYKEDSLEVLEGCDLTHIQSISVRQFLPKALKKLPALEFPNLRRIDCAGQLATLEKIIATYGLEHQLESMSIEGGLKKHSTFVFDPDRLPRLKSLSVRTMATEKQLLPLLERASFDRLDKLDLGTNRLTPKVSRLAAGRGVRGLQTLGIGGFDLWPSAIEAWMKGGFERLVTLDVRSHATSASRTDVPTGIFYALSRVKGLPIDNLVARATLDEKVLRDFVKARPFTNLRRLYLTLRTHDLHSETFLVPLQDALQNATRHERERNAPADLSPLRILEPLEADGVEIYVFR
jgi:hypothetical protein